MKRLRDIVWIPDFVLSVRKGDSDPGSPALDCMCVCGGVFFFCDQLIKAREVLLRGLFFFVCFYPSGRQPVREGWT